MQNMKVKLRIGIDPGKHGMISVWSSSTQDFDFYPIPLISDELDYHELNRLFEQELFGNTDEYDIHCVLEQIHAVFGSSAGSTFSFGENFGAIKMLLTCHNIPFTTIPPKKWQKEMHEGIPIIKKASSTGKTTVNDPKNMSLMAVKRLFPTMDLRRNDRCRVPDNNKIDALLLAEYCRRHY